MSQRFCLFYAGYTVCAPARYYNQLTINELLEQTYNDESFVKTNFSDSDMEGLRLESNTFVETVFSIAVEFKLNLPDKPVSATAFLQWKNAVISIFEERFPMTKIDHYYFLFGRRLAETITGVETIIQCLRMINAGNKNAGFYKMADKLLKDVEYDLFKMMAPSALLSGEHGHYYFSTYYKEISGLYKPFAGMDIRKLSAAEVDKLGADLKEYDYVLINGFKKCISLLKELDV